MMSTQPTDPISESSEQLLAAAKRVGPAARAEALAADLPVTYYVDGHLWQLMPDGTRVDLGAPGDGVHEWAQTK